MDFILRYSCTSATQTQMCSSRTLTPSCGPRGPHLQTTHAMLRCTRLDYALPCSPQQRTNCLNAILHRSCSQGQNTQTHFYIFLHTTYFSQKSISSNSTYISSLETRHKRRCSTNLVKGGRTPCLIRSLSRSPPWRPLIREGDLLLVTGDVPLTSRGKLWHQLQSRTKAGG